MGLRGATALIWNYPLTRARVASAERLGAEFLAVEVDVAENDLTAAGMRVVTAKVAELSVSLCAVVCD